MQKLRGLLKTIGSVAYLSGSLFGQSQDAELAKRDPQSVQMLAMVVRASGGGEALAAVRDVTASGDVTFFSGKSISGFMTIKMLGSRYFRWEAHVAEETRVHVVRNTSGFRRERNRTVQMGQAEALNIVDLINPLAQVASALSNRSTNIAFLGIEQRRGRSVYRVRIQSSRSTTLPLAQQKDFLIDALNLTIVAIEDHPHPTHRLPNNRDVDTTSREIEFNDFRQVNGISIPFSVTAAVHTQKMLEIRLTQIQLNTNLSPSEFTLSAPGQ